MGILHIEIVHYKGKNGSFATHTQPLWLPRIVGVDGRKRACEPDLHNGFNRKDYAFNLAHDWAEFLGCEVVEIEGEERVGGGPPP